MILKTFCMSVWWLVHAMHLLICLIFCCATICNYWFWRLQWWNYFISQWPTFFLFSWLIFFCEKGTSIRGYFIQDHFVFHGQSTFDLITIFQEAYLVFFFFGTKYRMYRLRVCCIYCAAFLVFQWLLLTRSKWCSW